MLANQVLVDQLARVAHRMNQHDVLKRCQGASVRRMERNGAMPVPVETSHSVSASRHFAQHQKARPDWSRPAGGRRRAARARRGDSGPSRHHDAVELEHRVLRRVDEGERPRQARSSSAMRTNCPASKQPRRLRRASENSASVQCRFSITRPSSHLLAHWILYGSSCRSCSSPPSITIAPWRRLLPVSENSKV